MADGQEIHLGRPQIIHYLQHFNALFAKPHHDAGFGEDGRIKLLHAIKQPQRMIIPRAGPNAGIKRRHGFQIMIEHIRPRRHHHFQSAILAQEIRRQYLNRRTRGRRANGADGGREMRSTAISQIIAIHAGDHHMAQPKRSNCFCDPARFIRIQRLWNTGRDIAEGTGAGAGLAHDHHGGVALRPAFADIRAGCFFAYRDQFLLPHQGAGFQINRMRRRLYPDPGGFALDGVVRAMRLFRMPFGTRLGGAMVNFDASRGHGGT